MIHAFNGIERLSGHENALTCIMPEGLQYCQCLLLTCTMIVLKPVALETRSVGHPGELMYFDAPHCMPAGCARCLCL
jgi:hypothetical protein